MNQIKNQTKKPIMEKLTKDQMLDIEDFVKNLDQDSKSVLADLDMVGEQKAKQKLIMHWLRRELRLATHCYHMACDAYYGLFDEIEVDLTDQNIVNAYGSLENKEFLVTLIYAAFSNVYLETELMDALFEALTSLGVHPTLAECFTSNYKEYCAYHRLLKDKYREYELWGDYFGFDEDMPAVYLMRDEKKTLETLKAFVK